MNDFTKARIFELLSESSQEVTNQEMQEAYGEFVEQIRTVNNGNYYSTTYRLLVAIRIEIASLETIPPYEQGENALKKRFLRKTLAIINSELELLNLKIQYPVPFQNRKNNFPHSPLYLTDETYLLEIMELVSGIFLSKRVVTHNGTESPLTEIGRAFEYLFNIKLGDIHKKHDNVICHKANKRTGFLDTLREAITEESGEAKMQRALKKFPCSFLKN